MYKRAIKEAKRRENDKYVLRANNKKETTWHVERERERERERVRARACVRTHC
jgi:hypothetical protein